MINLSAVTGCCFPMPFLEPSRKNVDTDEQVGVIGDEPPADDDEQHGFGRNRQIGVISGKGIFAQSAPAGSGADGHYDP